MDPRDVRTTEDARRIIEQRDIEHVKVGVFDIDGVLRGKYMSRQKFLSALDGGFGFCNVVLGWDSHDQLYDNVAYTGWHTGYPDAQAKIELDTFRRIPWERNTPFFLMDFYSPDGGPLWVSPRQTLRKVVARAEGMGYRPKVGFGVPIDAWLRGPLRECRTDP